MIPWLLALAAAAGCGGKSAATTAPKGGGGLDGAMATWTHFAEDAGNVMLAAQGCGPRADAMKGWVAAHGADAKAAAQALGAYPSKDVEARMDAAEAQHADLEKKMDAAHDECRDDQAFQQAWHDVSDSLRPPQAASPDQTPPPVD